MNLGNQGVVRLNATLAAFVLALLTGLSAAVYSPAAEARCCWRGGWFLGGAIVGSALARPYYYAPAYVYPAPAYYAPPVYYTPPVYYAPPPQVVYLNPPVITYPTPAIERLASQPAPSAPVASPAPTLAGLSIEDRLRRLQSACSQHLLDESECQAKRQELLKEM